MTYEKQIDSAGYAGGSYRKQERWDSFWHQIDLVRKQGARKVLEIGPGPGTVTHALRGLGVTVTTCDIADDVGADVIASVTQLPFEPDSFDLVLAAEILEHIKAEDVPLALKEISRVARGAVISVPTPGMSFHGVLKLPLFGRREFFFKIPFFWKKHEFDGQHYWELGTKERPFSWFVDEAKKAGLHMKMTTIYPDAPYHRFFVFIRDDRRRS